MEGCPALFNIALVSSQCQVLASSLWVTYRKVTSLLSKAAGLVIGVGPALKHTSSLFVCCTSKRSAVRLCWMNAGPDKADEDHVCQHWSRLLPCEQRFFSQMMDFSFVGNSQKLREGTCVIHCVPRSPAKPLRVAR